MRRSHNRFDHAVFTIFQQLPIGILHLLFNPIRIVCVRFFSFTGSGIGHKRAVTATGNSEHMKDDELCIPLQFQVKSHFGRIITSG